MNSYKALLELLPADPKLIVMVINHHANGTSEVETLEGGRLSVYGQSVSIGQMAWIQSNRILGEAPNLPYSDAYV